MDRIEELIKVLGDKAVISRGQCAKHQKTCIICCKPANSFQTDFARLEYSMSSICQICQDRQL